jgi:hypothetical protein
MPAQTYTITANPEAVGGYTITCHFCGKTSYSPGDVAHRYWCIRESCPRIWTLNVEKRLLS